MRIRSLWYKKIYFYLKSGQSISDAIKNSNNDTYIHAVSRIVLSGEKFSQACARFESNVFSPTEISLVQIGEQTGSLQKVILFLSDVLKNWYTQKQKLLMISIYPIVVLTLTAGLLVGILGFIVPKIKGLFLDLPNIPITTRFLMWSSDVFLKYWSTVCILFFVLLLIRFSVAKTEGYNTYSKKIKIFMLINIPYIRDVYIFWNIERWVHVFSICLEQNISLEKSFSLATLSIENNYIKNAFTSSLQKVRQGEVCSDSFMCLPKPLYKKIEEWIPMIKTGESSSSLQNVFSVFHAYIQDALSGLFEKIQKYTEPVLILGIGGIVLVVAVSIILPMYQLTQSIQ